MEGGEPVVHPSLNIPDTVNISGGWKITTHSNQVGAAASVQRRGSCRSPLQADTDRLHTGTPATFRR